MVTQIYQKRRDMMSSGSGFYIGPAGSGKTFALRNEIEHVMNNTEEIAFVISKKGEFNDLAKKYGGVVIDLAEVTLNPLLIPEADKVSKEDLGFLINIKFGLVKLLAEHRMSKLSTLQKYLLEQGLLKMYSECHIFDWSQYVQAFNRMKDNYQSDKIAEKIKSIKDSLDEVAAGLNLSRLNTDNMLLKDNFLEELEEVIETVEKLGSAACCAQQIPIGDSRLVIYDAKNMDAEDVDQYLLLAIEDVWTRLNGYNPLCCIRLCIDDADNLFQHYDKYLSMLYKVSRPQGFVITSVIQDADAFINKKPVFRKISSYFELYGHSQQMIEILRPTFNLTSEEKDWIWNAPTGQKLVICGGNKFLVKPVR